MKMEKMSWTMLAGCAVMLAAVLLLPLLGVRLGGAASLLIVLLCPLSHLLMMSALGKGRGHGQSRDTATGADGHPRGVGHSGEHTAEASAPIALPAPRERV